MILFVNACVRKDSRTKRLAEHLISKLNDEVTEVRLKDMIFPVADEDFLNKRDKLLRNKSFSDPMFKQAADFSKADTIVIAAPFWDLSFPSVLKQYLEQINVVGITFYYGEDGVPVSMCRADRLYYVTTSGGPIYDDSYGYGYVDALSDAFYGIKNRTLIKAEGLDIYGADVEKILQDAEDEIDNLFR